MAKFILKKDFLELFPDAELGVVTAKNIVNDPAKLDCLDEISQLLEESFEACKTHLPSETFIENRVVSVWREAFRKFKTRKGARCSIEAMLKRVQKDNPPGSINPLVDIYNAVSLTYALPCGGEDMDHFAGDLVLTLAEGGEDFLPLGSDEPDPALPGELIYRDDEGVVCRCWNWRDGQRTMLTENTKNAFLILESVDPERSEDLDNAIWTLAKNIQKYLGGEVEVFKLGKDESEHEL
jgi:DNA/RNA-binding domain of Phe-tRNA-synthetase-like protein